MMGPTMRNAPLLRLISLFPIFLMNINLMMSFFLSHHSSSTRGIKAHGNSTQSKEEDGAEHFEKYGVIEEGG